MAFFMAEFGRLINTRPGHALFEKLPVDSYLASA